MTERFSPEYMAFILSDEAKVLQGQWKPKVGDWCIAKEEMRAYGPGYVARWQVPGEDGSHRSAWVVVITPDSGITYVGPGSLGTMKAEFVWLPSLTDLLGMIEERWPYVDMNTYPQGRWLDDATTAHIMASAECVEWDAEGCGFWRCKECGDTLHDQPDGSQTYGSYPDIIDEVRDEIWEAWDGGANLPICPHCGEAREKGLLLAAAKLAVRVLEEGKE